jgi:two-component sensor histidine kinase
MRQANGANVTAAVDAALARLRGHIPPDSVQAYAFALACALVASIFEAWLKWLDPDTSPLVAYYPAVALTALLGGVGPGVMVAILGGVIAWWAFLPPAFTLSLERYGDKVTLVTFAFVSLFLVLAADHFRRVAKRLEDEEQLRQLAVQELAHRLKNKIATIQAIISTQLRDQPQIRKNILDRLAALTATDQLIEEANGRGAFIHDIANTELGPYAASRVVIRGPNVLLPPKYALTFALLVHELATNSAKYGSLSVPNGIISLNSRITDAVLELEWKEREGPPVSAPRKHGFGLRLLSRALTQLGGSTEILFDSLGVVCKMKATLPVGATTGPTDGDSGQPSTAIAT